ncbi:MAG TPA: hypothetical protein VF299_05690 [Mycobacterium sp.]
MSVSTAARKLRLALDMYEVGEQMQRMRLRRERPDADIAGIEAAVDEWRTMRPGAARAGHAGRHFETGTTRRKPRPGSRR